VFFSRQRADFEDLGCLGAQGARFEAKFGAQGSEPKVSCSRCPGSPWARPELFQSSPGCSGLLCCFWAAPGCSSLLPAPPTTEPQAHPEHDTQHGQLPLDLALHSEFSKQPGVHHQTRLNEISSRQVSKLDSNDWISSYVPFTTILLPIVAGPFLAQSSPGSVLLRVACYATQLLHKSFWCFFRVSEPILRI
jgi:hypothetical protein